MIDSCHLSVQRQQSSRVRTTVAPLEEKLRDALMYFCQLKREKTSVVRTALVTVPMTGEMQQVIRRLALGSEKVNQLRD